ncbi:MAG: hypothetical protein QXD49_08245 [Archaeoglobaceae archaeon]
MTEDSKYIKGKILVAIKRGKKHFKEIVDETKFSANTITKYTRELEKDGLIIIELDRNLMKLVYKLNKAKMDEINKLINAYLEHEKKELKEKMEFVMHYIEFTEEEKKEIAELMEKLKKKFGL